ncbi:MAG: Glu-tRNA(Gln) amidotransferase GatDE subunit D, partial [Methanobrevibacter sp.]|nr:Glu-tRNA(Gln) amidotransferase GatDE subunit D [Methanobrevibacter sp.]
MAYKEFTEKFLNKNNISIGDLVLLEKDDVSYEGILLDRSEDADDNYIVLKLDNGYNIGINISNSNT